jgi:hypothetical protein
MSKGSHETESVSAERAATWLSMACAVHCLLVPVLTAGLPLAGASLSAELLHHPALEFSLVALVLVGAGFTLLFGYRRHRDLPVLFGVLLGLGLYLAGHLSQRWFASALAIAGALLLAAASFVSARLSHAHDESCAH